MYVSDLLFKMKEKYFLSITSKRISCCILYIYFYIIYIFFQDNLKN